MITYFINLIFGLIEAVIFIDVIISWIPMNQSNKFFDIIHMMSEPILAPFRSLQERFSPQLPIDFSPMIALFLLMIIQNILLSVLV